MRAVAYAAKPGKNKAKNFATKDQSQDYTTKDPDVSIKTENSFENMDNKFPGDINETNNEVDELSFNRALKVVKMAFKEVGIW